MHTSPNEDDATTSIIKLLEEHKEESAFVKYFKYHWIGRIGMWAKCYHTIPHVGQETNGSIESYHSHLKYVWLKSIHATIHRRVDWLVLTLKTIVYVHYWWIQTCKENDFYRSIRIEKIENLSWYKAKIILDIHVTFHHIDPTLAWVQSQSDDCKAYRVFHINPNFNMCEYHFSKKGYLCKHVIKVNFMREKLRNETLVSTLFHYHYFKSLDYICFLNFFVVLNLFFACS